MAEYQGVRIVGVAEALRMVAAKEGVKYKIQDATPRALSENSNSS